MGGMLPSLMGDGKRGVSPAAELPHPHARISEYRLWIRKE